MKKLNTKTRIVAVGALSVALLGGAAAVSATAAVQSNGSDGPVYTYDARDGSPRDTPGYVYAWNEVVFGSPDSVDPLAEFVCPAETTQAYTFATAPGTERTGTDGWGSFSLNSLTASKTVAFPDTTPENQIAGVPGQAALKAAGGTLSVGVACAIDNGVNVVAAYYRTATVTAGTGTYTLAANADAPVEEPVNEAQTGEVDLSATTVDAENGVLALSVPAGATATIGAPAIVNGLSTSTGALPEVTVEDGRVVTREGWDLKVDVDEFVNSADAAVNIPSTQLGLAPKIVAASTTADGTTASAAQVAGSAVYPATIATAAPLNTVGDTVVGADLTFVAPAEFGAGTYTSTMTITVVSK